MSFRKFSASKFHHVQPPPTPPSAPSPVTRATNRSCGSRSAGGLKHVPGATANGAGMEHDQQANNTKPVCQPGMVRPLVYENLVNCQIVNVTCVSCGEAVSLISKLKDQGYAA